MRRRVRLTTPVWPLKGAFVISRGSKSEARTVVVEIAEGEATGRGECTPYPRYDETVEGVVAAIGAIASDLEAGMTREALARALPAGAARNAVDCALWDLEAKRAGQPVWRLAGLTAPAPVVTAYTLSLDTPDGMGAAARRNAERPLLKLKLDGGADLDRVRAVRAGAPRAKLIVDANEAWSTRRLDEDAAAFAALGVALIEQPLPARDDAALAGRTWPVPLCADESCHDRSSLAHCAGRYQFVNIKLDKTGGLTEALALRDAAVAQGFGIMVGCMMASSLAMAPAMLVAQQAAIVDLDGPLWLAEDAQPPIAFDGARMSPPDPALWG